MAAIGMHDAKTGFHDIKPIPQFFPAPPPILELALVLLGLLLLVFLLKKFIKKKEPFKEFIPPARRAEASLREQRKLLQKNKNNLEALREISSNCSVIIRLYLEESFSIPASKKSIFELEETLPNSITKRLPNTLISKREQLINSLEKLFGFYENVSFSPTAEFEDLALELVESTDTARGIIKEAQKHIIEEDRLNLGIIEQSKL